MGFTYEEKQSVSPLVDFIWRTEDLTDGVMLHQPTPLGHNFHSVSRWNLTRKALNCLLNVYPLRILRTAK